MFILFSLIVMRMSGAVVLNPIFGRNNYPARAKAAFVFVCSLMLYSSMEQETFQEPANLLEYGVMLVSELLFGFVLNFGIELSITVILVRNTLICAGADIIWRWYLISGTSRFAEGLRLGLPIARYIKTLILNYGLCRKSQALGCVVSAERFRRSVQSSL